MHEKVKDDDVDVRSCFASISYDKYYNKTTTTMIGTMKIGMTMRMTVMICQ